MIIAISADGTPKLYSSPGLLQPSNTSPQISKDRAVKLSTLAATRVTRLPVVGVPRDSTWQTAEATTLVTPQLEALSSGTVPLWVVVLAAVIGALLLLLLIFALYKVGFLDFVVGE